MKHFIKLLFLISIVISVSFIQQEKIESKPLKVIIDVAHGGTDFGNFTIEDSESVLVLELAQFIAQNNENTNLKIGLTRNDNKFVSLIQRANKIDAFQADYVISLHINYSDNPATNGIEVYYAENIITSEKSKKLAERLKEVFDTKMPFKSTTIKQLILVYLKR